MIQMTGFNTQISAECHSVFEFSNGIVQPQFSLSNICAIKSMILLENEDSPIEQARGRQRQGPKTASVTEQKNLNWILFYLKF